MLFSYYCRKILLRNAECNVIGVSRRSPPTNQVISLSNEAFIYFFVVTESEGIVYQENFGVTKRLFNSFVTCPWLILAYAIEKRSVGPFRCGKNGKAIFSLLIFVIIDLLKNVNF